MTTTVVLNSGLKAESIEHIVLAVRCLVKATRQNIQAGNGQEPHSMIIIVGGMWALRGQLPIREPSDDPLFDDPENRETERELCAMETGEADAVIEKCLLRTLRDRFVASNVTVQNRESLLAKYRAQLEAMHQDSSTEMDNVLAMQTMIKSVTKALETQKGIERRLFDSLPIFTGSISQVVSDLKQITNPAGPINMVFTRRTGTGTLEKELAIEMDTWNNVQKQLRNALQDQGQESEKIFFNNHAYTKLRDKMQADPNIGKLGSMLIQALKEDIVRVIRGSIKRILAPLEEALDRKAAETIEEESMIPEAIAGEHISTEEGRKLTEKTQDLKRLIEHIDPVLTVIHDYWQSLMREDRAFSPRAWLDYRTIMNDICHHNTIAEQTRQMLMRACDLAKHGCDQVLVLMTLRMARQCHSAYYEKPVNHHQVGPSWAVGQIARWCPAPIARAFLLAPPEDPYEADAASSLQIAAAIKQQCGQLGSLRTTYTIPPDIMEWFTSFGLDGHGGGGGGGGGVGRPVGDFEQLGLDGGHGGGGGGPVGEFEPLGLNERGGDGGGNGRTTPVVAVR